MVSARRSLRGALVVLTVPIGWSTRDIDTCACPCCPTWSFSPPGQPAHDDRFIAVFLMVHAMVFGFGMVYYTLKVRGMARSAALSSSTD